MSIKDLCPLRGHHFTREPFEEFDSQCLFKILNMPTDGGLRDPEFFARSGETSFLVDSAKYFQKPQIQLHADPIV